MSKLTIPQIVAIAVQAKTPILVWGAPGVGKSRTMEAIGHHLGYHVETVIASLSEPTDFAGIPYVHGNELVRAAPSWAKRIVERASHGQHTLLFLDEITTCAPAIQAALLRVVLDLCVGDVSLPREYVSIVAAANPPEIAAGGWDLAPPLLNRFFHLDWAIDTHHWIKGMIEGWDSLYNNLPKLPPEWESHIVTENTLVGRFIQRKPENLLALPQGSGANTVHSFPTPRSWAMAARLVAAGVSAEAPDLEPLARGAIGSGAALEYLSWRKVASALCDPEELLASPKTKVPKFDTIDKATSTADAVVATVISRPTKERTIACWHVLYQLWYKHDRKLDFIIKPATKLITNSAVEAGSCFNPSNEDHTTFLNQLRETMEKWHGLKVK